MVQILANRMPCSLPPDFQPWYQDLQTVTHLSTNRARRRVTLLKSSMPRQNLCVNPTLQENWLTSLNMFTTVTQLRQ